MINPKMLVDILYPPRCPVCGMISDSVCPECFDKIEFVDEDYCLKCGKPLQEAEEELCYDCKRKKHYFNQAVSLFPYTGQIKKSLYNLKYHGKAEYGEVYGKMMAEKYASWIRKRGITVIVPIPLHPGRQRKRGYNQASVIAHAIGKKLDIYVDDRLLVRNVNTNPQKKLSTRDRAKNLFSAFSATSRIEAGEVILLIDDIYTTGSTVDGASVALKKAGAGEIYVMCVAVGV